MNDPEVTMNNKPTKNDLIATENVVNYLRRGVRRSCVNEALLGQLAATQ